MSIRSRLDRLDEQFPPRDGRTELPRDLRQALALALDGQEFDPRDGRAAEFAAMTHAILAVMDLDRPRTRGEFIQEFVERFGSKNLKQTFPDTTEVTPWDFLTD